jgi:hypothetical protein
MAFPESRITAVYDLDDATRYEKDAPLNQLVLAMAERIVFGGQDVISTD